MLWNRMCAVIVLAVVLASCTEELSGPSVVKYSNITGESLDGVENDVVRADSGEFTGLLTTQGTFELPYATHVTVLSGKVNIIWFNPGMVKSYKVQQMAEVRRNDTLWWSGVVDRSFYLPKGVFKVTMFTFFECQMIKNGATSFTLVLSDQRGISYK